MQSPTVSSATRNSTSRHITMTWVVLVLVTLLTGAINGQIADARVGTIVILLIAAFKIHLICTRYMELKRSHRPWWKILHLWLLVCTAILVSGFIYSAIY